MSGSIRIHSPNSSGGGGGFHDLERSASPVSHPFATSITYRDHPIATTTTMVVGGTDGSPHVITPTNDASSAYHDDPQQRGYRDFDGEEEEGEGEPSHSLPHVEDVRMRAMNIINNSHGNRSSGVAPASIFICLSRFCTTKSGWLCTACLVLIFIISLSVGLHNRNENNNASGDTSSNNNNNNVGTTGGPTTDNSAFPYPGFTFASDREEQIVRYLLDVSTVQALKDTRSPQRRAAQWLALNDTLHIPIPDAGMIYTSGNDNTIPLLQRYAIVTLYYSLQGPTWNNRGKGLSWMIPSSHECNWNRPVVTSASSSTTDDDAWVTQKGNPWATPSVLGVICNSQKVVTGIYLDGVNAKKHSAFLTPEIGTLLPMLNLLNLDNNNIYGPLPRTLSEVVTLRSLSLAHNHLPGTIPFSSLPLSQLRFLDLSNSLLTGSISEQDYFPRVKFLYLSNNTLTGTLPQSLAGWTNLQVLALDRNQLKGPLVSTLNSLWKLEQVYLESNSFSGTLDGLYANVDPQKPLRLQIFDISSNNLDGSLPSQLFQVPTLRILDLHQNRFGGQLPTIDGEAVIDYVNLKSNQLVGSIPHSWANLKQLTHLDLSFNDMGGVIPATFPALTQLSFLYLTDYEIRHRDQVTKKFDKSFPSVLESMISLRELGLHNTRLTGSIPTWIGLLTNLRVLAIDDNALSGTIPTEMGNLSLMRFLLMEKNNLDGTIPTEFGQMKKLQALLLEVNPGIIGTIHNSSAICVKGLDVFVTDCKTDNQIQPHIVCSCCTHCCDVGYDKTCQSKNYVLVDQDTNWRKGYNNPIVYDFDGQVVVMGTRN